MSFYTTPASKLGMSARDLVENRIRAAARRLDAGKKVEDTFMLRAFARTL